ncbi:tyrosyl-tRNA synthetase [Babesia caballi]|uniref:tyrosine--tRNA ligase n=1 Tax=Babesia caballi TaxID=5871 RepID=A0AAV4LS85_BABCB|nr:tyrosyl-tRNA synthetase [Babesia caballi]
MWRAATRPPPSVTIAVSTPLRVYVALALLVALVEQCNSFRTSTGSLNAPVEWNGAQFAGIRGIRRRRWKDVRDSCGPLAAHDDIFTTRGKTVASPFLAELVDRGVVSQATDISKLDDFIRLHESNANGAQGPVPAIYYGIDLTADFIHEGTLLQLLLLRRFLARGFNVVVVLGGGTTPVGDPSFKTRRTRAVFAASRSGAAKHNAILDRAATCASVAKENYNGILDIVKKLMTRELKTDQGDVIRPSLAFASEMSEADAAQVTSSSYNVVILDNSDLYNRVTLTEYLNTVASNMSVGRMLSRDCIRSRLLVGEDGATALRRANMDLAEFMYMSLQAMDFVHVASRFNAVIQLGGSDQMGNIMSGVELASSLSGLGKQVFGITTPLLQTRSGEKISKSSGECMLRIRAETPALSLWSHLRNVDDEVVASYLQLLTLVPRSRIQDTMAAHVNESKVLLADELTTAVFGRECTEAIHKHWLSADIAHVANSAEGCSPEDYQSFERFVECVPSVTVTADELASGIPFGALLDRVRTPQLVSGLFYSNRRAIREGTCRINGRVETRVDYRVTSDDLLRVSCADGRVTEHIALQFGKRQLYFAILKKA